MSKTLVDIVIPVYNEQAVLAQSVARLHAFMTASFPYTWRITIADNASKDRTWEIAQQLQDDYPEVRALHLDRKGRGLALRTAWLQSEADIVSYMDVDLSTGLESFWPMIEAILDGEYEVATGSRLAKGANIKRQFKRELTSRGYNFLIKAAFFHKFSDAQCGFKAVRAETVRRLLPLIENNEWFFDTELLLLAEHNRLPIFEVPVVWIEDLDSRVNILKTAQEDLKGLWRLRRKFWRGEGRLPALSDDTDEVEEAPGGQNSHDFERQTAQVRLKA